MNSRKYIHTIVIILLLISCKNSNVSPIIEINRTLSVSDTIGVDQFSNGYILMNPTCAKFTPYGDIAVLDPLQNALLVFSENGEYINSIGGPGEGPGRINCPNGFVYLNDNSILISDRNYVSHFDYNGNYIDRIQNDCSIAVKDALIDGTIFCYSHKAFIENEDDYAYIDSYGLWDHEFNQIIILYSNKVLFTPRDNHETHESNNHIFGCISEKSGRSFFTEMSREQFLITGFENDGSPCLIINDESFCRISRTEEEIQYEKEKRQAIVSAYFGSNMNNRFFPDQYRPAINNIYFDNDDNLWVQLGTYSDLIFRVYNMDGDILYHVKLNESLDTYNYDSWDFSIGEHGILALNTRPLESVYIYVLELDDVQ